MRQFIRGDQVTIRVGPQIPNFSYGTGVGDLYPTVIAQAREAEAAGFDSLFVMDHFYQLPPLGSPDQPMLEAYTALDGLATATERSQPGSLVTGNTYRDPSTFETSVLTTALVDKDVTAEVIPAETKGRMVVGTAEATAEQIKINIFDVGVDPVILNQPVDMRGLPAGADHRIGRGAQADGHRVDKRLRGQSHRATWMPAR
ncbi:alkanesulfonate monooxygenase SsuD/methylene tetrahydromethanopterin reductase-like flavin-dependent oxidoreductase (luciferase family) [Mycobacterium sp. URHB0021]|jgi:hypothetical protein